MKYENTSILTPSQAPAERPSYGLRPTPEGFEEEEAQELMAQFKAHDVHK